MRRCRLTVCQTVHTHRASVHQAAKIVAAHLSVAGVTAGLAESNGSLPSGLWLTPPAGWLPRTGITSGTLHSVIEYGLPLPFLLSLAESTFSRKNGDLIFTHRRLLILCCSWHVKSLLWYCWLGVRTDEVLVWLSVCSEVQTVCIWSSWCHCHPTTPSFLA